MKERYPVSLALNKEDKKMLDRLIGYEYKKIEIFRAGLKTLIQLEK